MQYIELSPVAAFLLRMNIITVPQPYLLIGVCMLQSMHGGRVRYGNDIHA